LNCPAGREPFSPWGWNSSTTWNTPLSRTDSTNGAIRAARCSSLASAAGSLRIGSTSSLSS